MLDRSRTRPRNLRQLANSIVDVASSVNDDALELSGKNLAVVPLGRLGGLKGRAARANSLLSKQRSDIAREAAQARYGDKS